MVPAASPEPVETGAPTGDRGRTARLAIAAALTAVALVAASLAIGRLSAPGETRPTDTSVEAGFARDMQEHHLQAVELAMMVRDRTDDPDVRLLAYDIATSQSQQSGQMFGWLAEWELSQAPSEPSMTWMLRPTLTGETHGHGEGQPTDAHVPGSPMPGIATADQIAALAAADGIEAERQFLTLMIAHHIGGVEMAEAVLARSTDRVVVDLATSIVTAQQSEIDLMESMLAERSS